MSKFVNSYAKLIGASGMILAILAILSLLSFRLSLAQNKGYGLRDLIQHLVDNKMDIYLQFSHPTSEGRSDWTIPEDIEYEGKVAGRRVFEEVGDDYICAKEIGQGIINVYCVPFSNIAYVNYFSP